jgi:hypothetical protein
MDTSQKIVSLCEYSVFRFQNFKNYEKEFRLAAEKVVETSCIDATVLEKKLTLEQSESIAMLL